jgi:capsular polysaccharide export protein
MQSELLSHYEPFSGQDKSAPVAYVFGAHGDAIREPFRRLFGKTAVNFFNVSHKGVASLPNDLWQTKIAESLDQGRSVEVFTYGFRQPQNLEEFATSQKLKLTRFEDAFIRCNGIGGSQLPWSWCFDSSGGLYFNPRRPSDLENFIQNHDPATSTKLLAEGDQVRQALIDLNLTKYNHGEEICAAQVYGPKERNRLLVLGQVEDDASIAMGCETPQSNNQLVTQAYETYGRDYDILYRPHPYVLDGLKKGSNPQEVAHIATIIRQRMPFANALETIDMVMGQSSLTMFEAAFRGIPAVVTGCPFYAGWQTPLITSLQPNTRRTAQRSIGSIFAEAYCRYSLYFNPLTGEILKAMDVIQMLLADRERKRACA